MKPLGAILQHMHESGSDNNETLYDVNDDHHMTYNGSTVCVVGVSHDGSQLTIHLEDTGEQTLAYSQVEGIDVYKLTKVA